MRSSCSSSRWGRRTSTAARTERRSIPALGRGSYIFNPTIEGIEQADAILIIGADPRFEASVLNARIRKRFRMGNCPVGVIGDIGDLRYAYERLGSGAQQLKDMADGASGFASGACRRPRSR